MVTPNSKVQFTIDGKTGFIGSGVQRTIGQQTTYRLRRGNGQYGAELGVLYQDKFSRVVPSSINHPNGDTSRACFAAAILAWQSLSNAAKNVFNRLAGHIQHLSGYNLYVRRYMQENY